MRMTNKIMQNNSLYNINNNKVMQDKLSTQMSTQKKLTRPSDDPVVAIRALRLRTTVSELTQYYEKNAPDAESWLAVSEKALTTGTAVLTDIINKANLGANKDRGQEDLAIIVQQMETLRDEYYSTGNVDYAGRYVFTGYRTDTTLSFTDEVEAEGSSYSYDIIEPVTIEDFDSVNYTDMHDLAGLTKSNYDSAAYANVQDQDIENGDIHRIRLSYDNLNEDKMPTVSYGTTTITPTTADTTDEAYQQVLAANKAGESKVVYVPETGEILFSDKAFEALNTAVTEDTPININYTKDEWKKGDLRPEHYFQCTATVTKNGNTTTTQYNFDADVNSQIIEYDVGYNQKIRVNTMASEAFTHNLDRDIDDLKRALSTLTEIDATVDDLDTLMKNMNESDPGYEDVKRELSAAKKAYSYVRESIHDTFQHTITSVQKQLDETNIAITDNGTRSSRLDLVSNRLMEQKTTFETLQSENEDVDIAEVIVNLTSTELTYNAALMATGKIMQTSLMNYI